MQIVVEIDISMEVVERMQRETSARNSYAAILLTLVSERLPSVLL